VLCAAAAAAAAGLEGGERGLHLFQELLLLLQGLDERGVLALLVGVGHCSGQPVLGREGVEGGWRAALAAGRK